MLSKRLLILLVGIAVFTVAIGTVFTKDILNSYNLRQKLAAEEELAKRLTAENDDIRKKINLLKTDLRYVEMLARNELGMVSKSEVVIHFGKASFK